MKKEKYTVAEIEVSFRKFIQEAMAVGGTPELRERAWKLFLFHLEKNNAEEEG